jgi:hypothetical protein
MDYVGHLSAFPIYMAFSSPPNAHFALALELKKIMPVELRSVGLSEKWLQDQIAQDTTILKQDEP